MIKDRILLIEDNKALSKIITKKMNMNLDFEIVQAHTFSEAEGLITDNNDFFIALCDLNLPDAPNGEIVDFVISKGLPVIVLTGSIDENLREDMLRKNIVDYVYKGNIEDVNYIFFLIERLSKNRDIKVMVVDDSLVSRKEIKRLLQSQMFKVLVAAHGEEALGYLEDNKDIKLVLTDYSMPVIDGIELTKRIRTKYNKTQMIVVGLTGLEKDDHLISARFLKIGANDFLTKPFSKEELVFRISNSLDTKEYIDKMVNMAHIDFLTNLYNRRYFFEKMEKYHKDNCDFAIAMIDIDLFKKINDTYGHEAGDKVIRTIAHILKEHTKGQDIVSRFGGEEFCVALRDVDKKNAIGFFARLRKIISDTIVSFDEKNINFTVSIGVSFKSEEKIDAIVRQADEALYRAKNSGRNRVEIA